MKKAKAIAVVVLLGSMLLSTACSASWIGEAEEIVAALIPATANLVTLVATLQGRNISAADLQTIQSAGTQAEADLQLLSSLIAQYEKADATAQPGLLNEIGVALGTVQSTLNSLLPALHIKDAATQAKVGAVVGLLISEVQSMVAIVPLVKGTASPTMMTMAAKQVRKQAPLSAGAFVGSYNATMTAKTGDGGLDHATSGLAIHSHSKIERWATAGRLK